MEGGGVSEEGEKDLAEGGVAVDAVNPLRYVYTYVGRCVKELWASHERVHLMHAQIQNGMRARVYASAANLARHDTARSGALRLRILLHTERGEGREKRGERGRRERQEREGGREGERGRERGERSE